MLFTCYAVRSRRFYTGGPEGFFPLFMRSPLRKIKNKQKCFPMYSKKKGLSAETNSVTRSYILCCCAVRPCFYVSTYSICKICFSEEVTTPLLRHALFLSKRQSFALTTQWLHPFLLYPFLCRKKNHLV